MNGPLHKARLLDFGTVDFDVCGRPTPGGVTSVGGTIQYRNMFGQLYFVEQQCRFCTDIRVPEHSLLWEFSAKDFRQIFQMFASVGLSLLDGFTFDL